MKKLVWTILITAGHFISVGVWGQSYQKGMLLYSNSLASKDKVADWVMEGAGQVEFVDGWMKMFSPKEKGHSTFWCPKDFPKNFIAEWEVQNLHTEAGLCIIFFAATGLKGEDIFAPSLPKRNGIFKQYTKGAISNYHISYYANGKTDEGRETANLRKNKGFQLVQSENPGIPIQSKAIHKIRLIKQEGLILMFIDERKVVDWQDDGKAFGKILEGGKIGFRQMKWTQFNYRNFNVWECVSK
jgi:hypothetical protein